MPTRRLVTLSVFLLLALVILVYQRLPAQVASENRLSRIVPKLESKFEQLESKEDQCTSAEEAYVLVAEMQQLSNDADLYAQGLGPSQRAATDTANGLLEIHAIMKMAAILINYPDLHDLHERQLAECAANISPARNSEEVISEVLGKVSMKEITEKGKDLAGRYSYWGKKRGLLQNASRKCEIELDQSKRPASVNALIIEWVGAPGCGPGERFAKFLTLQFKRPIVKNFHIKYYEDESREPGHEVRTSDYFVDPKEDRRGTQDWIQRKANQFLFTRLIELKSGIAGPGRYFHVPPGEYYIHTGGSGSPRAQGPSMVVPQDTGTDRILNYRWIVQTSGFVEVNRVDVERISTRLKPPKFSILDFQLGTSKQTRDLDGSFGGRMFQRFGSHLALQTQGQFEFRNYSDRLDLDQVLLKLKLAGQNLLPREQRGFTNYSSREFQLDVGPVLLFGNAQFAIMQSLRYVTRGDFDQGGMLGQFFFNAGYLFKNWGQIGVFGTKANFDQPVVKSVQFNQVFFEETYLKVADQLGLNFQISLPKQAGYLEGALGYLNTTWPRGAAGGTLRYVTPWPTNKCSLTAEVGYNEGFVRSGENPLRVGFGMRLGNWSQPSNLRNEKGPVPVIVPAIRYETLTRTARRGNNKPQANAGPDINNVDPGALVTLDGRGSFDPDSDPITYKWIEVSGPSVTLANPNSVTPSFQAGSFGDNCAFKLIVCDDFGLCSDDPNSTACPGSGTSTDACVSVTVRKTPKIGSFTATPAQIDVGQCSTLSWETSDADHVTLAPGIGEVPVKGSRSVCPTATTKYTLTAYSGAFSVSSEIEVSVRGAQIVTFSAAPPQVDVGECSTLSWKVQNAVRITIAPGLGEVPLEGSRSVCPTATTKYTLTAFSADSKTVTQDVQVTVRSALIQTFSATPPDINAGESSTLSWKVLNAVKVTVEPGFGEVPLEGSRSVSPTATTKYTLTAFGADNKTVTQDVQVTVRPPQVISFTADATSLCSSQCTTLRWSTSSAVRVVISPDIGEVPLQGSRQVCPTSTTTYTLTAFAAGPGQTATASVQVTVKPLPKITLFNANKTSISAGDPVTLSWVTEGADTVILTPPGRSVSLSGSMVVAPTSTQRYDLTAKNACSQVTQSITIYVNTPLPGILSFTAIPPQCLKGQCSQLNWQVSNAQSVSLTNGATGEVKNVTGQSALQVCPMVTTTYTLRACNSAGECVSADAMVTVIVQGPPSILTFEANPPEISAGATSILSWVIGGAEQVTLIDTGDGTSTPVASVVSSWPVSPKNTTVYTLVAVNRFAASVTASVTVTVK